MRYLLFVILLGGCGKDDPGPPCPAVTDHLLDVTKQGMTGHGNLEMGNRKVMIADCERRKLSKEARECIMAATDLAGLAGCSKLEPPAPKPAPIAGSADSGKPTP